MGESACESEDCSFHFHDIPTHQTWNEFADANADLLTWKDIVLKKYYREETLASELAKTVFLFPDQP